MYFSYYVDIGSIILCWADSEPCQSVMEALNDKNSIVGKEVVLGESVALSSNVNLLIIMTKMITAESFKDFRTAKKFQDMLDDILGANS